jgi:hypothetical protein
MRKEEIAAVVHGAEPPPSKNQEEWLLTGVSHVTLIFLSY